jgi:hypothetical protein
LCEQKFNEIKEKENGAQCVIKRKEQKNNNCKQRELSTKKGGGLINN